MTVRLGIPSAPSLTKPCICKFWNKDKQWLSLTWCITAVFYCRITRLSISKCLNRKRNKQMLSRIKLLWQSLYEQNQTERGPFKPCRLYFHDGTLTGGPPSGEKQDHNSIRALMSSMRDCLLSWTDLAPNAFSTRSCFFFWIFTMFSSTESFTMNYRIRDERNSNSCS